MQLWHEPGRALPALAFLLCARAATAAPTDLAVVQRATELKAEPSAWAETVAAARPGDRFEIVAARGPWFQVRLFHDIYFLPRDAASEVMETVRVPEDEETRKAVFREIYAAEDAAMEEWAQLATMEQHAPRNPFFKVFLLERHKLEVARRNGLGVPACLAIALEGADQGWPARSSGRQGP